MAAALLHIYSLLHLQHSVFCGQPKWDDGPMSLLTCMIEELQWWVAELQAWNGKLFIPAHH